MVGVSLPASPIDGDEPSARPVRLAIACRRHRDNVNDAERKKEDEGQPAASEITEAVLDACAGDTAEAVTPRGHGQNDRTSQCSLRCIRVDTADHSAGGFDVTEVADGALWCR